MAIQTTQIMTVFVTSTFRKSQKPSGSHWWTVFVISVESHKTNIQLPSVVSDNYTRLYGQPTWFLETSEVTNLMSLNTFGMLSFDLSCDVHTNVPSMPIAEMTI